MSTSNSSIGRRPGSGTCWISWPWWLAVCTMIAAMGVAQLLPEVPPPSHLSAQLAQSAASRQLANEFVAFERGRHLSSGGVGVAAGSAPKTSRQLDGNTISVTNSMAATTSSGPPVWSLAMGGGRDFRLDQYHPLDEVYEFLAKLASRYPTRVHLFTIGFSGERRPIKALEVTNNASDPDFVWLDATTHAREWVTTSTLIYMLDQIVAGSPNSSNELAHRKNYLLIPIVNPDGYVYTWTTNRMWRKNRSRAPNTSPAGRCLGADLNRNFDLAFGGEGSSAEPCSHIYSGPYPFSEPEIRALADLLWSLRDRIKFYLTIHSYNQLWACPYAHTTEPSAHLGEHMRVLRNIRRAITESGGAEYEIGPLSTSLYVGSGFGIDFAYDKCGIWHAYLVELRDKGQFGFLLPPDQIIPTARETWVGLRAGLRAAFR